MPKKISALTPEQWRLVESHRNLAVRRAKAVANGACWDDVQDVVGAGVDGLIAAAEKYDPNHLVNGIPVRFATFAEPFVRASMVDHHNALMPGPRHAKEHAARLRKGGIDPSSPFLLPEDLRQAERLKMCPATIADRRRIASQCHPTSFDSLGLTAGDHVASPDPGPDMLCEASWTREMVREAVGKLPTAERLAVIYHEFGGMNLTETAELVEVSLPALRELLQSARALLREWLAGPNGTMKQGPRLASHVTPGDIDDAINR